MPGFPNPSFEAPSATSPVGAAGWAFTTPAKVETVGVMAGVGGDAWSPDDAFDWYTYLPLLVNPTPGVFYGVDVDGTFVDGFEDSWSDNHNSVFVLVDEAITAGTLGGELVAYLRYTGGSLTIEDDGVTPSIATIPSPGPSTAASVSDVWSRIQIRHPEISDLVATVSNGFANIVVLDHDFPGRVDYDETTSIPGVITYALTDPFVLTVVDEVATNAGELLKWDVRLVGPTRATESFAAWYSGDAPGPYLYAFDDLDLTFANINFGSYVEDFGLNYWTGEDYLYGLGAVTEGFTLYPYAETFENVRPTSAFAVDTVTLGAINVPYVPSGQLPDVGALVTFLPGTDEQPSAALPVELTTGVSYTVLSVTGIALEISADGIYTIGFSTAGVGRVRSDPRYYWTTTIVV